MKKEVLPMRTVSSYGEKFLKRSQRKILTNSSQNIKVNYFM